MGYKHSSIAARRIFAMLFGSHRSTGVGLIMLIGNLIPNSDLLVDRRWSTDWSFDPGHSLRDYCFPFAVRTMTRQGEPKLTGSEFSLRARFLMMRLKLSKLHCVKRGT